MEKRFWIICTANRNFLKIIVRCYHNECILRNYSVQYMPKCEIFDRSDFHDFYTLKPFWLADFEAKISTCYFNFLRELGII